MMITHDGQGVAVQRHSGHPEQYLYIECDGGTFFLGVLEPGMTRGDVKRLATSWLSGRTMPSAR